MSMDERYSKYLSVREYKALEKAGDIIAPQNGSFPSFSQTGCARHVDSILRYTDPQDLAGLKLLFLLLSFFPSPLLYLFLKLINNHARFPNFIAAGLRLTDLGIRGLVWSLYYSNKTSPEYKGAGTLELLGYQVHCAREES
jgi:hypothetical protein